MAVREPVVLASIEKSFGYLEEESKWVYSSPGGITGWASDGAVDGIPVKASESALITVEVSASSIERFSTESTG